MVCVNDDEVVEGVGCEKKLVMGPRFPFSPCAAAAVGLVFTGFENGFPIAKNIYCH